MRSAMLFLFLLLSFGGARAEIFAHVHSERPFGYFVGDLIHAWVDIHGPSDATIQKASLPQAGPVTMSLDLRDVALETLEETDGRRWRLRLTYQNFYVALDVRDIEIPKFTVALKRPGGDEIVEVPAWNVGVVPLRAVRPMKADATDYLRPDGALAFVDESSPRTLALGLAGAALLGFVAVAHDRAWPPFQARRARVFAGLARRLTARARRAGAGAEAEAADLRSVHRAIDAAFGRSVLAEDLDALLRARPEFEPARHLLQQFFAASDRMFFDRGDRRPDYSLEELGGLVRTLAHRERAG